MYKITLEGIPSKEAAFEIVDRIRWEIKVNIYNSTGCNTIVTDGISKEKI